ncbi:MAG: hypothetical protein MUO76_02145, partial [Anaerolineaceae bacterium]|nr:hypothetical protein [Anaerolineaceae bacterium]
MKKLLILFLFIIPIIVACGGAEPQSQVSDTAEQNVTSVDQPTATQKPTDPPPPTETPSPTETPISTETPVPTSTPLPTDTSTPLPEGVLFRDDFNGSLQPGWEFENENPDRWTITDDGWLQIIGENDALLGEEKQSNLLWYPLPEGDFVISVHLKTMPFENFHQSAIFIYEDIENYITINRGYCDICETGGGGFYMDYKISGAWGSYQKATDAEDVYLRLESKDDTITGYFAVEPDVWE